MIRRLLMCGCFTLSALLVILMAQGCSTTQQSQVAGAAIGTVAGYQVGDSSKENQWNAVIGGVAGYVVGGAVGSAIEVRVCPKCAAENGTDVKYCGSCGQVL